MKSILSPDVVEAVNRPTATASALPNAAYRSDDFFQAERDHLFSTTWTCIGNACSIPNIGDARPVELLGMPLLMIRQHSGSIAVFHNVCRHRGNQLVREPCTYKGSVMCPYHGWTYDTDGTLLATPHVGGHGTDHIDSIDQTERGLHSVRTAEWLDLVFVNISNTAPAFEDFIAPLGARAESLVALSELERVRPATSHGAVTIEFAGNWKLCIENNLESYHLPWVHPDLNALSRLEDHYDYESADFAGQGTLAYDHTNVTSLMFPVFDGWNGRVAEYPTLYPNVFIGFHCDHLWTRIIEPLEVNRSLDHFQIYYLDDAAHSDAYELARKERFDVWKKVILEDLGVVEGMQLGRRSPAFDGGVFSPAMDAPSHHFAKWVANTLDGKA